MGGFTKSYSFMEDHNLLEPVKFAKHKISGCQRVPKTFPEEGTTLALIEAEKGVQYG